MLELLISWLLLIGVIVVFDMLWKMIIGVFCDWGWVLFLFCMVVKVEMILLVVLLGRLECMLVVVKRLG